MTTIWDVWVQKARELLRKLRGEKRLRRVNGPYLCEQAPTRRHFVKRNQRNGTLNAPCAYCSRYVTRKSARASAWKLA